jgi:hypothetical protein
MPMDRQLKTPHTDSNSPPNLAKIAENSREFDALATAINNQLTNFGNWLNALPGKSEVTLHHATDESGPTKGVAIGRLKGRWTLFFASGFDADGNMTFVPLEQVSLSDKCDAILMLPDLLQKLYDEQSRTVAKLKEAAKVLTKLPELMGGA